MNPLTRQFTIPGLCESALVAHAASTKILCNDSMVINMYLDSFSVQEVAEESKELMRIALEEVGYNVNQELKNNVQ